MGRGSLQRFRKNSCPLLPSDFSWGCKNTNGEDSFSFSQVCEIAPKILFPWTTKLSWAPRCGSCSEEASREKRESKESTAHEKQGWISASFWNHKRKCVWALLFLFTTQRSLWTRCRLKTSVWIMFSLLVLFCSVLLSFLQIGTLNFYTQNEQTLLPLRARISTQKEGSAGGPWFSSKSCWAVCWPGFLERGVAAQEFTKACRKDNWK